MQGWSWLAETWAEPPKQQMRSERGVEMATWLWRCWIWPPCSLSELWPKMYSRLKRDWTFSLIMLVRNISQIVMHKHMVDIVTNYFIFWKQFYSVSELNQFMNVCMYVCIQLCLFKFYIIFYVLYFSVNRDNDVPTVEDRRWLWDAVWCEPSGSFPAYQLTSGLVEEINTQPCCQCFQPGPWERCGNLYIFVLNSITHNKTFSKLLQVVIVLFIQFSDKKLCFDKMLMFSCFTIVLYIT